MAKLPIVQQLLLKRGKNQEFDYCKNEGTVYVIIYPRPLHFPRHLHAKKCTAWAI